jgi:23S rRNA pseudouridine1911/1915/1917 synthase
MRLDQALAERFPEVSRRKARDLIAAHCVLVNDRIVSIASREIKETDRLTIAEPEREIAVLKTTRDWIAVNKPTGIPTQPDRERSQRSLEELLRVQLKQRGEADDIWVVHRIDTPTSGVVVFARTRAAAATLGKLFSGRTVEKVYAAVVDGVLEKKVTVNSPIDGKSAVSHIRPLRNVGDRTIVEAVIETGRTHQVRIHCNSIGHPVSGDRRYGSETKTARPMLHAWKLRAEELGELEAPWPDDFPPLQQPEEQE